MEDIPWSARAWCRVPGISKGEGPSALGSWESPACPVSMMGQIYSGMAVECVCCLSQLPELPAGPPLSDTTAAAGKVPFQALALQRGGKQQERGNFTKSRSWHWRGSRRSCVSGHPTLCHRVDESFLLLSNHAWNASCHLGYFCYLSLLVPQC